MLILTVVANLLIKMGNNYVENLPFWLALFNTKILLGIFAYAAGGICLLILMKTLPLNVIQACNALQYIAVILAAAFFLHEPISLMRWLGIVVICFGILIVSRTLKE
jgi:drug/metabolite transporter (DMT)-like permease